MIRVSVEEDLRELEDHLNPKFGETNEDFLKEFDIKIEESEEELFKRGGSNFSKKIGIFGDCGIDTGRIEVPEDWQEFEPQLVEILREGIELDESIERLEGSIFPKGYCIR